MMRESNSEIINIPFRLLNINVYHQRDQIDVKPGSIVLVDGRQEHQTFNTSDTDMQFTMIYDNIGRPPADIEGIEKGDKPYTGE